MIKIDGKLISAYSISSDRPEYKSELSDPHTINKDVKIGIDFKQYSVSVRNGNKKIALDSLDKAQSLNIVNLIKSAMELGGITQEQYQELQKEVEVENEQPNIPSTNEPFVDRIAREFTDDLKKQGGLQQSKMQI